MTTVKVEYGKGVLFLLGSTTNGVLGTNALGIGEVLVDVSNRVDSLAVSRGRRDVLDPVVAGRSTVVLQNRDGLLDPLNTSSPLYPGVEPSRTVKIYGDDIQVFEGKVDDISLGYSPDGVAIVTLTATDGFESFSLAEFPAGGTAFSQEDSGSRVSSVLGVNLSWWTGGTAVSSGDSTLAAGTATGNVLQYLNTVSRSEAGAFFVSRDGVLTFRNRYYEVGGTALVMADDGSGDVAYQVLSRVSAAEDLRTVAVAERDGTTLSQESTLGVLRFGVRTVDLGEMLLLSDEIVEQRLRFELNRRDTPYPTVSEVQVSQQRQASTATIGLELGDPVEVVFTPPGVSSVTEQGVVGAVGHTFSVGAGWRTTVRFEKDSLGDVFVLGTSTLGVGSLGW
jgi:hypothetical protein